MVTDRDLVGFLRVLEHLCEISPAESSALISARNVNCGVVEITTNLDNSKHLNVVSTPYSFDNMTDEKLTLLLNDLKATIDDFSKGNC